MPKKTARHQPVPRKITRAKQNTGLIAKAETPKRSARTKCVLDNRSHRTDSVQLQAINSKRPRTATPPSRQDRWPWRQSTPVEREVSNRNVCRSSGALHDGSHGTTKETEQRLETTLRFSLRAFARDALTPGDHVNPSCPIIDLERAGSEHAGTLRHGAFDLYRLAVVLLWPIKQVSDANRP